jgi:hypothetical protein
MSPIFDITRPETPNAPGLLSFGEEGVDPPGFQVTSGGEMSLRGAITGGSRVLVPEDQGWKYWNVDPRASDSTVLTVNGTVYLLKIPLRGPTVLSSVAFCITTVGASPTANQCWAGLVLPDGTVAAKASAAAITVATAVTVSLTPATYRVPFVWVGLLFNAGTPPTLLRGTFAHGFNNAGAAATELICATGATSQTDLLTVTPASMAAATPICVAVA